MASRFWPRLYAMAYGAASFLSLHRRRRPEQVSRVLIAHNLMLGDTIMLTPLLKKARQRFPDAEIVMTVPRAYAPLYSGRPYGVMAVPLDPRSLADHRALRRQRGFDLAILPADNRWSWLARALASRWIVAFASDNPGYKDWPVDERRAMPQTPMAWGEIAATLLDGADAHPYSPEEWPAPAFAPYPRPKGPYCVLHLGASSPHKLWPNDRWSEVLQWAEGNGYRVVLSCGRGEERLLNQIDRDAKRSGLAGRLDLPQLWDLLRNARFLVCPDTGIAHLARLVGVPTAALYGPGSPISTGPGRFWGASPFRALWDPAVPCRDQDVLFERRLVWLRQCWRGIEECGDPVCIRRITVEEVIQAIGEMAPLRA
jgi:ADP-heptose:LPS heptosyltransferase